MFFPPLMGLPGQQPPQAWLPQLPPFSSQPAPQANTAAAPPKPVKGSAIGDWLCFCDFHPHCEDDLDFLSLAKPFKTEGFRHLVQLTSGRTTVEQLSTWFKIGKGTANLIIGYADEDIVLVHDGKFTMDMSELDNGEEGSGGWA